ncbi:MAG: pyruvate, phosphate dikinase [Paracoccaceae bacterium]
MRDVVRDIGWIGVKGAGVLPEAPYGSKAHWLSRAAAAGAPVPPAAVLPDRTELSEAALGALETRMGARLGDRERPLLLAVRASGEGGGGGACPALLNIGMTREAAEGLARRLGARAAADLARRAVQGYATAVLGADPEDFEDALHETLKAAGARSETELDREALDRLSGAYRALADEAGGIPEDPRAQLAAALAAMAEAWRGPRARARRQARGHDPDAALALMVQAMVLGIGPAASGAGIAQLRDPASGARRLTGRYLPDAQGDEALMGHRTPMLFGEAERKRRRLPGPTLETAAPQVAGRVGALIESLERALGDAVAVEVTVEAGEVHLLEVAPLRPTARGALRIAVELAEEGAIGRAEALLRLDPSVLEAHLHPTLDPDARRDRIGRGLPASPGAASGALVFTPDAAEAAAAEGRPAILALVETSPEDIRGMHAAAGVITVRGGMTSHAAVVARGLGRPCVVGAKDLALETAKPGPALVAGDGRRFGVGDVVTVVGGDGEVLAGAVRTRPAEISGAFASLMGWADRARRMRVRANADTVEDADIARRFAAEGIGLCRTEHMFFARGRIAAVREMILAESPEERRGALARLRPMQQADFTGLFRRMAGLPVVIRLLDPPLHEFLPHRAEEMAEMAALLAVPVARIEARAAELAEFNPMLGKRGCRIGIAYPEIYEMQAEAIFEAAASAAGSGQPVRPEIMIPLVSVVRELEVLRARIDAVAETVRARRGTLVEYTVGVMIETPRACLRAGDIARIADFLSFGTNDLTQMLYGLSRDDAGRFIPDYVAAGVFPHDPFHRLDEEGVGEIIRIAIERARATRPSISIGLCGEHGGDPVSIDFCERVGFDYVSCSPFRVPVARLSAAQASLRHGGGPR